MVVVEEEVEEADEVEEAEEEGEEEGEEEAEEEDLVEEALVGEEAVVALVEVGDVDVEVQVRSLIAADLRVGGV